MKQWLAENMMLVSWLGAASLVMFVATLIAVPIIVVRIPQDHFTADGRLRRLQSVSTASLGRMVLVILKNLAGLIFVVCGVVMLILPGQGVLTILVGALLLQYPGKVRFERWLVSRRPIFRSINWIRRRRGRPPLLIERKRTPKLGDAPTVPPSGPSKWTSIPSDRLNP